MRTGKLFRYSESQPEDSEVALLERDFADYLGVRHALAVNSCTTAIELALVACGAAPGSKILVPGFTFTAVPSAIVTLHAIPVFVECTKDYRLDIDDLRRKITPETKILLLSHMRGHISEMDEIADLRNPRHYPRRGRCARAWRTVARQADRFVGQGGLLSFQSNKVINSGEGGMLTTDDDEIIVRATYLSGAYEANYEALHTEPPVRGTCWHASCAQRPDDEHHRRHHASPNGGLEEKGERYRQIYASLKRELTAMNRIEFPQEYAQETRIPDAFRLPSSGCRDMMPRRCRLSSSGFGKADFRLQLHREA